MDLFWEKLLSPASFVVFIFSSIFGSYMNVLIYRLPRGILTKMPKKGLFESQRSYCPHCQTLIPWYLNIPILGYLYILGRTKCCKQKLSIQYPIVELLTASLAVFIYWTFPFLEGEFPGWTIDYIELVYCAHAWVFCFLLLTASVIDFHHYIIPDGISIGLIASAPLIAAIHPSLTLLNSISGILLGGGILYSISWAYFLLRKEQGLGFGDVKLLAGIGGWLGIQSIVPTLLYSSLIGTIVGISFILVKGKGFKTALPFGPFLSLGAFIHLLFGNRVMDLLLIIEKTSP